MQASPEFRKSHKLNPPREGQQLRGNTSKQPQYSKSGGKIKRMPMCLRPAWDIPWASEKQGLQRLAYLRKTKDQNERNHPEVDNSGQQMATGLKEVTCVARLTISPSSACFYQQHPIKSIFTMNKDHCFCKFTMILPTTLSIQSHAGPRIKPYQKGMKSREERCESCLGKHRLRKASRRRHPKKRFLEFIIQGALNTLSPVLQHSHKEALWSLPWVMDRCWQLIKKINWNGFLSKFPPLRCSSLSCPRLLTLCTVNADGTLSAGRWHLIGTIDTASLMNVIRSSANTLE